MDAAEYKHIVLGLIFVKYISDTFQTRSNELTGRFADPEDDYYLPDADGASLICELEDRDYYREVNVFWLTETLGEQMAKGAELDGLIRQKLGGLGYEF